MYYPQHKLSAQVLDIKTVLDQIMPHVDRIEGLVQDNPDLFHCSAGQIKMKAAADFLEAYVESQDDPWHESQQQE